MTTRPRILVTNDDGIESRGLLALKQALEPLGEVLVIAPETNQSAVGHSRTMWRPLRVRERTLADGSPAWSIDGSPSDAVGLVFLGLLPLIGLVGGMTLGALRVVAAAPNPADTQTKSGGTGRSRLPLAILVSLGVGLVTVGLAGWPSPAAKAKAA